MTPLFLTAALVLATGLFAVGLFGLMIRRGILFQIIALEIMLTGPALAFVAAGAHHGDPGGQGMFIFVLVLAASEVALGLALYLRLGRHADVSDSDTVNLLRR
ncbi:NADH-quinone oxidoreductase subunit NuoK [Rhodobaculum claviforme]|uniref:NADH-quinone oxidoreductase subunit K n=1 Tax=Rhodobaculum claviforme TaxID=1549854 RepID=A0A934TNF8_9RHOB|nr:NADH-quinone oxidoreductase subunit NuoK [Rhodobaculum claviforme]MBK5928821.1 NADH-quinone oxidoreductase subunit K [Rhodobaculum claviforme]